MNQEKPTTDYLTIINHLRQQIYMMGANDSENNKINEIIKKMESGEITGEEAVKEVALILESKQDYH